MTELFRLFVQIGLLRKGPQDLPASGLLLALTVLVYVGINLLGGLLLPSEPGRTAQLLVTTLFTLTWYALLLRLVGRAERTPQTLSALFGFQIVLCPLLVPFEWVIRHYSEDATWQGPVMCVGLLLLGWMIAANSHIVKAALEWSGIASAMLVILQMLVNLLLLLALFSAAND
jgi:hypothetical protein